MMEIASKTLGVYWRFLPASKQVEERRLKDGGLKTTAQCISVANFILMVNKTICDRMMVELDVSPDIQMAIDVFEGKQTTLEETILTRFDKGERPRTDN